MPSAARTSTRCPISEVEIVLVECSEEFIDTAGERLDVGGSQRGEPRIGIEEVIVGGLD